MSAGTEIDHDLDFSNTQGNGRQTPASLEMLSEAAASAARHTSAGLVESANQYVCEDQTHIDGSRGDNASFETELSEFLGNGSYGMMDVWVPFDSDGIWSW